MRPLVKQVPHARWARIAAMIWVMARPAAVQAQELPSVRQDIVDAELPTIRGKLELHRLDLEDGSYMYQLTLEGKVLYTEPEDQSVYIDASYPKTDPVRVVLLRLPTGGNACPAFYSVLEIKDNGGTVRSKKFGNCVDDARSSFTHGVLRVDFRKAGRAAAESWTYQNGTLSKVSSTRRK